MNPEERTLIDTVPGGGTVELGVTATATNTEIEEMVLSVSRFHANAVHAQLAEQTARWRERLYAMRAEIGGEPAPEPHASDLPPSPMPGRMRYWPADGGVWLQWVAPGKEMNLDNSEAQRVPVSATDTDADLEASAEKWLTAGRCGHPRSLENSCPSSQQRFHSPKQRTEQPCRRPECNTPATTITVPNARNPAFTDLDRVALLTSRALWASTADMNQAGRDADAAQVIARAAELGVQM